MRYEIVRPFDMNIVPDREMRVRKLKTTRLGPSAPSIDCDMVL